MDNKIYLEYQDGFSIHKMRINFNDVENCLKTMGVPKTEELSDFLQRISQSNDKTKNKLDGLGINHG